MDDQSKATPPQIKLIETLYANLRIRNTSLYGGLPPAELSKRGASEVIDVLTLRKLSGQLARPVTADLTNPAQVREQLERVEQLTDAHHMRHAAATATRARHLRNAAEAADRSERQLQDAKEHRVRMLPHLRRLEKSQAQVQLPAARIAECAAELDPVKEPRLDAANRYSDATGYGSAASYNANNGRSPSDAPELTDGQERKIIELQAASDDTTVSSTVIDASDYLDDAFAPAEPLPPTERQIAYLHKLERQAGKTTDQLSHPGTRQGASRRIQRLVDTKSAREDTSVAAPDLALAIACASAALPPAINEEPLNEEGRTSERPALRRTATSEAGVASTPASCECPGNAR